MFHYVYSSLIYNSQKLERTQMSLNRGMDTENVVHLHNGVLLSYYKQWIYEILGQMDVSGGYHPEWCNPITKEVNWYSVTDKWILAQKPRIPKIQLLKHNRIKKEDQRLDTSFLPRIGNKISMEGVTETKFRAKMKGWTIHRLPHPGVHPIISHQTQTPLYMPARFWWRDPGIAVSYEAMPHCLANTEVDAHSHLKDGTQGPQWRS